MKSNNTRSEATEEQELRQLVRKLESSGMNVRREKLSSGPSFRVKSGSCQVFGERVLFVDRSLPVSQQLSFLTDYIAEHNL